MALTREEVDQISQQIADNIAITIRRYSKSYEAPKSIQSGLAESMGEELTASMWYQLRARDAKDKGDSKTAELYYHIAEEENLHYIELNRRREEILGKTTSIPAALKCSM
jgi:rubrerythrin